MPQSATVAFLDNLVQAYAQTKALQFQKEMAVRQDDRYNRQLEENRLFRHQQLEMQKGTIEENRAYRQETLDLRREQLNKPAPSRFTAVSTGETTSILNTTTGVMEKTAFPSSKGMSVNIDMKPAPATALKEITDYQSLSGNLETMRSLIEATKDKQGPGREFLTETQAKWGKTPVIGTLMGGTPPPGILELQKASQNGIDILARLRTGAAISENEEKLYGSLLPRIDMPYETNVRNYDTFKKFVDSKISLLQESYKELGYRVPGMQTPVFKSDTVSPLQLGPKTKEEFQNQLKQIPDENEAKRYYDQWSDNFTWD